MSNNIGSFSPGQFNLYQRIQDGRSTPSPSSPSQPDRVQRNAETTPPSSAQEMQEMPARPATGQTPSLSQAEEAMIQREFPTNKDLSMRLYGPNRSTQNVAPDTLGRNLDVRG